MFSCNIMKAYSRLTVDMYPEEHACLKMACVELDMSMREFVIIASFKAIELLENKRLSNKAKETVERFKKPIKNRNSL